MQKRQDQQVATIAAQALEMAKITNTYVLYDDRVKELIVVEQDPGTTHDFRKDDWLVTCTNADKKVLITQVICYSDFSFDSIQLFFIDNILLLPSEY